ncbi:MAG: hypothetical protein LBI87_13075 [Candidatus Accumulibacter sp.]|jgi:hypothetical protein|nr:hypothetical protein [Accumulibacter sp.]
MSTQKTTVSRPRSEPAEIIRPTRAQAERTSPGNCQTDDIRPTRAQAELELELLEIEAEDIETGDLYASLRALDLPREAAIRLEALSQISRKIGGKILAVGKIIVLKLLEFIRRNPGMAAGMALGAAISALINAVPVLGTLLAPVALTVGVAIGAVAGHRLDKGRYDMSGSLVNIAQDALEIAKDFFAMLIALFRAVGNELAGSAA